MFLVLLFVHLNDMLMQWYFWYYHKANNKGLVVAEIRNDVLLFAIYGVSTATMTTIELTESHTNMKEEKKTYKNKKKERKNEITKYLLVLMCKV